MGKARKIRVTTDETSMVMQTIEALAASGCVFQRGGSLVEPRLDPARKLAGLLRPAEELKLSTMSVPRIRSLAAEFAEFVRFKDGEEVREYVPEKIAAAIGAMPAWPDIPVVESLSENPVLRPDGTVHAAEGYDPYTGNYFSADGVSFPPVPDSPTREDARSAIDELLEPFHDFPFVTEADKSVVVAIILTMLARPAIPGPTPPFVIRTPTPRTGKDLLTDVMSIIGTGRPAPGRSLPVNDDEELKKLLLSIGRSGSRVVSFGNCEGGIGSPVLSHVVTKEVFSQRQLARNDEVTVPMRPVWLFNGNNVFFKGDFGPRVVLCNMDAGVADPQSRTGWKYDPLLPWVRDNRPRLVKAGLTVLRAYCVAGRVRHGGSRKGSFEGWDDLVRGAILWAGAADPLGNDKDVRVESDADVEVLTSLLVSWRAAFSNHPVTLRDAVEASQPTMGFISPPAAPGGKATAGSKPARLDDEVRKSLAAAFADLDPKHGDRYTAATLRYALRHHKGRPIDVGPKGAPEVLSLEIAQKRSGQAKVVSWCVLNREEFAERGLRWSERSSRAGGDDPPPPPPDESEDASEMGAGEGRVASPSK